MLLCAEGEVFQAHRFIIGSCSEYLHTLLTSSHVVTQANPIIWLDIPKEFVKLLLNYMYNGEVTVKSDDMRDFLAAAQKLRVKGLLFAYHTFQENSDVPLATHEVIPTEPVLHSSQMPITHVPCPDPLELAQIHTDMLMNKYTQNRESSAPIEPLVHKPPKTKSPPAKRRRVSGTSDQNLNQAVTSAAAAVASNMSSTFVKHNLKKHQNANKLNGKQHFNALASTPVVSNNSASTSLTTAASLAFSILNHVGTTTAAPDASTAELNTSNASEVNPLPLVKVEMQDEESEEGESARLNFPTPSTDVKNYDSTGTSELFDVSNIKRNPEDMVPKTVVSKLQNKTQKKYNL